MDEEAVFCSCLALCQFSAQYGEEPLDGGGALDVIANVDTDFLNLSAFFSHSASGLCAFSVYRDPLLHEFSNIGDSLQDLAGYTPPELALVVRQVQGIELASQECNKLCVQCCITSWFSALQAIACVPFASSQ